MNVDSREVLGIEAARLLRSAARFDDLHEASTEVIALVGLGLLRLRYDDRPADGYVITAMGSDVVQGSGPFLLPSDDEPFGNPTAPVS